MTYNDLKTMQAWSLERKIQVTQTRIIEWYQHYNGKVYISFSGGKDSTVLLDLTRRIYPDTEAVFVDTGLEYPEIREFVKSKDNVTWLKPKMNFRKVIETYGYPLIGKKQARMIRDLQNPTANNTNTRNLALTGYNRNGLYCPTRKLALKWIYLIDAPFRISEQCCDIMKKRPCHKYEIQTGKKPFIGTMACESEMREKAWKSNGCNAFDKKRPTSQPMSFWTEQDVLQYLKHFNIPYASVYGEIKQDENGKYYTTGCNRTGCVFCGFGCHLEKEPNRFQRLKKTHPQLWEYCMKSVDKGGLGMKEVLEYIGVKTE